ncbi:MAG: 30S ribosomal protein S6 [Omnitrophica bacterium]|nr:30S ribosomal protein S6 [Candidatus Omnitrophota bacterium]
MDRNYESMMILMPDLADQEREEIFGKITKRVENLEGKVLSAKVWAKDRNFYYFLRGRGADRKKYFKGCYWLIDFILNKDKLPEFQETIRLEERILRIIIINKENQTKSKFPGRNQASVAMRSV